MAARSDIQKDDGYVRFHCHACGKRLKVKSSYEGGAVVPCPKCQASVVVPLANLEAIASEGKGEAETKAWLRRLNIRPDDLRRRLNTPDVPVSDEDRKTPRPLQGGPPSIRVNLRAATGAFERIPQLDQLSARVKQIEDECIVGIQRLFRNKDLTADQRKRRIKELGENRRRDIQRAIKDILSAIEIDMRPLKVSASRLSREQLDKRDTMEAAQEAIKLYAYYVCGMQA
jgi:predicted RNA-binding Zn-ribbon protein involved in translation (DUF1610 family)